MYWVGDMFESVETSITGGYELIVLHHKHLYYVSFVER